MITYIQSLLTWIDTSFAMPTTILFLGVAIAITIKMGFLQFRGFSRFVALVKDGLAEKEQVETEAQTINSFHALFAAMATTIGMGNVVGPSIAIISGGPGALFWLIVYIFFGSATKFAEVTFALHTRETLEDGAIIGGPMCYLRRVSPFLANWYIVAMLFVFAGWSSAQSNTLAQVLAKEGVPVWATGALLSILVLLMLRGGAKRIGAVASRLVPIMFIFYVSFSMLILFKDLGALRDAIALVFSSVFAPSAALGGIFGIAAFKAMHAGVYKGIFVTEAGVGTSSIPHSMADAAKPTNQGLLAMFSMMADAILCSISGLLVLVTGVWTSGEFSSTLMYEAFRMHSPHFGRFVLVGSLALFIITTAIGNSFNGTQTFAALTRHRWMGLYISITVGVIFLGAVAPVKLIWDLANTLITFVAIPNLIGLTWLVFKYPKVLNIKK